MECGKKKTLADLGDKSAAIFSEFMLRIAKFEELVDTARQLLLCFYQEFETFRRPQAYKASQSVDHIIEVNQTERMKAYVEAGSRHRYQDVQNIIKLHTCNRGLQEHLVKVKVLLDELECLKEDAVDIARQANHSAAQLLEISLYDEEKSLGEEDVELMHLEDKPLSHAALMVAIYNMMKLDYSMQEKIIDSIKFTAAKSEQLESYCLMWNLRPYINDNVIRQGWKLVSC